MKRRLRPSLKHCVLALIAANLWVGCSKPAVVVNVSELEKRNPGGMVIPSNLPGQWYRKSDAKPFVGKVQESAPTGQLLREVAFKDGRRDGLSVEWYPNGTKKAESNYRADILHGEAREWFPNGKQQTVIHWANGELDGVGKAWQPDGKQQSEVKFKASKQHGIQIEWYKTGKKAFQIEFFEGKRNGIHSEWYENGNLKAETSYGDGFKHGVTKLYYENGKIHSEAHFRKDIKHGLEKLWLETGEVSMFKTWADGNMVKAEPGEAFAGEVAAITAAREKLDSTLWKLEEIAQKHEEAVVGFWDAFRNAKDKWAVVESLSLGPVRLGKVKEEKGHDWGIREVVYFGDGVELDKEGWRKWIGELKAKGVKPMETEWHQQEFKEEGGMFISIFGFLIHAEGEGGKRWVVKGKAKMTWSKEKDVKGHAILSHLDVSDLYVLERNAPPEFSLAATLDPAKDNASTASTSSGGNLPKLRTGKWFGGPPLIVYDLNKDGLSEVILAGANLIYWNKGNHVYETERLLANYPGRLASAMIVDLNKDGRPDLFCVPDAGYPSVYLGTADGKFAAEPIESRVGTEPLIESANCTAGDVDGDGDIDIFVTQYKNPYELGQMPTPFYDANDGFPSFILLNDGKGRFVDGTEKAGLLAKRNRRTYSSSFVDLDGDGDLDLIVVSDFSGMDVYFNDGKGKFEDRTAMLGGDRHSFGMSHAIADFNGDGKLDIYMAGMGSTTARRLEKMGIGKAGGEEMTAKRMPMGYGNRLFLGGEKGELKQAAYNDVVSRSGWAWGTTAWDFDNDGDRDLYIANGNMSRKTAKDYCTTYWRHDIYTGSSKQSPALDLFFGTCHQNFNEISWNPFEHKVLYMNEGGGKFLNVAYLFGLGQEYDSRSLVGDDLDGDGRVDLILNERSWNPETGNTTQKMQIYKNGLQSGNNWIGVRLSDDQPGASPIGATVFVKSGGRVDLLPVITGDSFSAQHSLSKHFGLGKATEVDSIEVRWPDGRISRRGKPHLNQYHILKPD